MSLKNLFKNGWGLKSAESASSKPYKDLVVMGSSSTELFDYIFGDNPQYHPFWASGWNARSANREPYITYTTEILKDISRDAIIFLNFGNSDIDFILRYKMNDPNFNNRFDIFVDEIVVGLIYFKELLVSMGFKHDNIFAVFANPPVQLPISYWINMDKHKPALIHTRGLMHKIMIDKCKSSMRVIDVTPQLSNPLVDYPVLDVKFMRDSVQDHHQDYVKTQQIVWDAIRQEEIEGLIPPRNPFHKDLYPHTFAFIGNLMEENKVRQRTCR